MIEAAPSFGLQTLRERTEKGLQPRLWEMRAVLAMLDDYRAGADEEARAGDEARAKVRDLTEQAARDKVLIAELARHNEHLTSELQDAEQRAREAQQRYEESQREGMTGRAVMALLDEHDDGVHGPLGVLRGILTRLAAYDAAAGTGEKASGRNCTCGRKDFCTSWCGTELPNEAGTAGGEGSK